MGGGRGLRSGGAKMQGKLSVRRRPTNLDNSKTRAYCVCSRSGLGLFGHFSLVCLFFFLSSFSLSERRPDIE